MCKHRLSRRTRKAKLAFLEPAFLEYFRNQPFWNELGLIFGMGNFQPFWNQPFWNDYRSYDPFWNEYRSYELFWNEPFWNEYRTYEPFWNKYRSYEYFCNEKIGIHR